jgi:hypothetical protein
MKIMMLPAPWQMQENQPRVHVTSMSDILLFVIGLKVASFFYHELLLPKTWSTTLQSLSLVSFSSGTMTIFWVMFPHRTLLSSSLDMNPMHPWLLLQN